MVDLSFKAMISICEFVIFGKTPPLTMMLVYLIEGATDQKKEVDVDLWIHAMLHESEQAPPFLPLGFEEWANDILHEAHVARSDIHSSNISDFYCFLISQPPPTMLN